MTEQPRSSIELAHAAAMPAPQGGALPTGMEWEALERMASTLANSDVIPYRLKRKPADVAVILLAAREYGIPPLMALSKLPVVNGTPAPMGELMVALVLRAGHYIAADFHEPDGRVYAGGPLTPQHYGEARYKRRDWTEPEVLRFTLAEAVTAGLVTLRNGVAEAYDDKNRPLPWMQYTPNMARWRAVANACRLAFADVLLGLSYLPEELGAVVDAEGAPVEGEPVGPRGAAPTGSIEQRTAQEAADRLAAQPWPDATLDAVRGHAADNGYLDATVTYADERMTLADAIRRHVADRQHADTVDAELVEEPQEPQEPQGAPQEAEQPVTGPESQQAGETPQEAAIDMAREALVSSDADYLRTLYRAAGNLRILDVISVIGDDDIYALEAPAGTTSITLGQLLMAAGKYVTTNGTAVRDLGEGPAFPEEAPAPEGPDPWAADAAAGWPKAAGSDGPVD